MLVLSRKPGQTIVIDGGRITIKVIRLRHGVASVGINAERAIDVVRGELIERLPPTENVKADTAE